MNAPLTLIKLGGNVLVERDQLDAIWSGIANRMSAGEQIIVVHGAGPQTGKLTELQGGQPRQVHGRRITDEKALRALLWSARGELNARLVSRAGVAGVCAVGLSGVDAAMVQVHRRPPWTVDGETVDFQFVGDVDAVDDRLIRLLLEGNLVPAVAPLGVDSQGEIFNVNADTVATQIGVKLGATRLMLITGGGGVRESDAPESNLIAALNRREIDEGVAQGSITEGMRVKLANAITALEAGIAHVEVGGVECLAGGRSTTITL